MAEILPSARGKVSTSYFGVGVGSQPSYLSS